MALALPYHGVGGWTLARLWKDVVYGVTELVGGIVDPLERTFIRPIGERLQDWERDNRETLQRMGDVIEDVAREVGPALIMGAAGLPMIGDGDGEFMVGGRRPEPGLSTGAKVAIGVGGVAIVGAIIWAAAA